jgi:argininosuccinate synthase
MKEKVVLAFSGGLDTSYCAIYLAQEMGLEVHAAIVNTGGFSKEELQEIAKKANLLKVASFTVLEATEIYYRQCVKYLIFGNVLKNNTYPLSVSAERVVQAMQIVDYAHAIGAKHVAHGSTGAGNDQVRFDLIFRVMAPDLSVITPIRDQRLSREQEVAYLVANGIDQTWTKAKYSINKGLWGTSVGGAETLTSDGVLPNEAYPSQPIANAPRKIILHFRQGEPVGIDGKLFENPYQAIQELGEIASAYAIGRDTHVGDTIIGIKGRVGFEAPASLITIKAHHLLEKHVLTKWQAYWKEQLGNWYGMMLHEGLYLDPVMRNIEKFLEDTQQCVTGEVDVLLEPYHYQVLGIRSPHDLMASKFGSYGEMNLSWSGEDVKGFTKIISNQLSIYHQVNSMQHD